MNWNYWYFNIYIRMRSSKPPHRTGVLMNDRCCEGQQLWAQHGREALCHTLIYLFSPTHAQAVSSKHVIFQYEGQQTIIAKKHKLLSELHLQLFLPCERQGVVWGRKPSRSKGTSLPWDSTVPSYSKQSRGYSDWSHHHLWQIFSKLHSVFGF